jgi:N-acetyl sugar amidotransferase
MSEIKTYYNLPSEVKFCSKCVNSNQYPASIPEFTHQRERKNATYVKFDKDDVCEGCLACEQKTSGIDWVKREESLLKLLDKYRRKDGRYDCVVPGSGGKDSAMTLHLLKYKYGMNPLFVTWSPIIYTEYGLKNFNNLIDVGGFDNISFNRNGKVLKTLTRLSIENLLHPFQTFIIGQKNVAPKVALQYDIPLIFYGENQAEYGNPISDNDTSLMDKSFYTYKNIDDLFLAGVSVPELREKYNLDYKDLMTYLPPTPNDYKNGPKIAFHYLGYYVKWIPQEAYYYAVENTGFKARPYRSQGTYSKYSSIDDRIDDLHYYTTFIKFGIGRATYDACQEIRNNHIIRDEGKALVGRYDGEFPDKYFDEIMEYLGMEADNFHDLCNEFRSPHLWKKVNGEWKLRHNVNLNGAEDN